MITGQELRSWLVRPSRSFAGVYLALGPLFLLGVVGSAGACWYLATGDVRGGRPFALALLGYVAACAAVSFLGLRRSGRVRHVVLGVAVGTPLTWVDSFLNDDRMRWRFPLMSVLLALGLLWNLVAFVRRSRAAQSQAPVPTTG